MCRKEQFYWVMLKDVTTQVAGMMLHQAEVEKFVAALRDALPKVERISTSLNSGGNKNVACYVMGKV